nr:MAG TPA: hypothetical protein [Caudoviricetes sp.]
MVLNIHHTLSKCIVSWSISTYSLSFLIRYVKV